MSTYNLAPYPSDTGQNAVKIRPVNASTSGVVRVGVAAYGAVDIRIMRRSGDVYLATNEKLTAAGVPYTGDADTDEILDLFPDVLERVRRLRSGEEETFSIEEIAAEFGIDL